MQNKQLKYILSSFYLRLIDICSVFEYRLIISMLVEAL